MKKEGRAAFEALRAELKRAGCRVTALDEALAEENWDTGGRGPTQADTLIQLAQSAELFHAPDGTRGRSVAKRSVVGWRAASSRRRRARRVPRRCNRH